VRRSNRRAATATPAGALGRGGRGRVAPAEGGLRAVHQQVLRSFAIAGRPPAASDHPEATGEILDQPAALRLGTAIFGPLLAAIGERPGGGAQQ